MTNELGSVQDDEARQAMLEALHSDFDIDTGELNMLYLDMPDAAPVAVYATSAVPTTRSATGAVRTDGICTFMGMNAKDNPRPMALLMGYAVHTIDLLPKDLVDRVMVGKGAWRSEDDRWYRKWSASLDIEILRSPKHGEMVVQDDLDIYPSYLPAKGYIGKDRVDVLVRAKDLEGRSIAKKLVYFINVIPRKESEDIDRYKALSQKYCAGRERWRISSDSLLSGTISGNFVSDRVIDPSIATLLTAAFSRTTFSDLSGSSVGETTGTGPSAQITLDTSAAGLGWFNDYTPYLNEEFLPTSNPNEWVAKPGSAAEGKMDLLSVLLHEYGHALGLDHSHDAHDFMATTLQPGVRRTLTVDQQLELMALSGYFPVPDSPSQPYGPTDPGAPLPFTRTNASRFGRMRPNFGQGKTEFDTVANPKLENPDFADGSAWATQGDVAFGGGAATLKETSSTQTRLNQVFVVGEHDRFLSFTLAGLGMGDQIAGPDDAFEVALIDASTGAALLGGTGLSKSDAFLNLQANGNERIASAVSRLQNADGSRTYLVDLAGIAAGTVVNLSFDLIGFGKGFEATNSQITVRDLRLGVPQTADDSASGSEDSPIAIDALANDLNALQPGFVPVIVSGPAHGSVAVEADGSFTYLPNADWSGEDEFTYRLSDGVVDSNLATVSITVAPVNDAPTLADLSIAGLEDTVVSGNVLSTATDVDGDALTAALVTGPAHGTLQLADEGGFTYTSEADWYGEDSFTVRVNDGVLDSAIAAVRLTVAAVNDAPVGAADVDGDALSVLITTQSQHGTLTQNADGTWTYAPDANRNGKEPLSYTVSDGQLGSELATIRLTITAVNDAPRAVDDTATLQEDGQVTLALLSNDRDLDGWSVVKEQTPGGPEGFDSETKPWSVPI